VGDNEALALIYENASFYTRGALEFAEQYYNKVIDLEPFNPVPNLRLALVNMARSNAETDTKEKEYYINEAIKRYDEAITKKNDFAAAYYGKAVAYEQLKKYDESIEQMKSAVVYASQNIDYQFELGRLMFNRGVTKPNLEQTASKQITEGDLNDKQKTGGTREDLSVQPDQSTGSAMLLNEDMKIAEQIFLGILQQNPNHANALYSLGLLYQKSNQTDNAKLVIKKLLEVVQDEPTKDAVKKQFPGLY
jgi:tetratricopeptide (TPR) repeat protein